MANPLVDAVKQAAGQQPKPEPSAPSPQMFTMDEVKEVIQQQSAVDRELRELLEKPGAITRKQVMDGAVRLVAKRILSAQAAAGYLIDLPTDPQLIRNWVERHAALADDHLTQLLAKVHSVNQGMDATGIDGGQPPAPPQGTAPPAEQAPPGTTIQ